MRKIGITIISITITLLLSGCGKQPELVTVNITPNNTVQTTTATEAKPSANPPKTTVKNPPVTVAPEVPPMQTNVSIPSEYLLKIVFAQQAPFGNWDALHEEACEEASMIMADRYFRQLPLDETIMEAELQKLIKWEEERGYKVDLTAQETVDVLKNYFGRTAHLSTDVTVDQIKYEISQGRPIIIPAAGRELGNPNFKQPGPIYHMLVIKGYNSSQFITNDPGTRKGNSYIYPYNSLMNAIHDWNPALMTDGVMTDVNMAKGAKVIVVVDN